MLLPTVKVQRLYRQISNLLIQAIRDGRFAAGQLLPAERDLAKQLGVSRSSVREALIALEINGWVEIRTGNGVYVRSDLPDASEVPAAEDVGVEQLLEAREAIEGEVAALAARNATEPQFGRMDALIGMMEGETADMDAFHTHDRRFHLLIGEMTGNPVFTEVVELMWKKRETSFYASFERAYSNREIMASMCSDHRLIREALRSRDPERARAAMRGHLKSAHDKLFGGKDRTG
ncbi:FadR/GntR family transcriptional regulator [Azospirillum sp. SYSU D00513]|uniref:FadR/GntR family transcriptional regulator n=1 Tax=Azospirillum sp. SYSU D00513 TaxID=2812561 RepID=UPI001A962BFA|nr:FadR/GntR family transcriptional regulator [Azospirillum sp. SYSU D00513]